MLTKKELLRYKKSKGKILPQFIDVQDEVFNELALALCDLFSHSIGKTHMEVEQDVDELTSAFDIDNTVLQGLKKLCFDLLRFDNAFNEVAVEFRSSLFRHANKTMDGMGLTAEVDVYRQKVVDAFFSDSSSAQYKDILSPQCSKEKMESFLYSDLPHFQKVIEFKSLSHVQLLNKYNVSLVQGLLFYCRKIKIILPPLRNMKAQFRQLIRQIKFFQLVAYFIKEESSVVIEIDGPLSLFIHTQKYGFHLACFFPALLFMPQWELVANIEMGRDEKKFGVLHLSHKVNLISHYKNYSAYIPQEFELFAESFAKLNSSWSLNECCDEFLFDNDNYFFPDYSFTSDQGQIVFLEIFHPWHAAALKQRLIALAKKTLPFRLLIGVAKVLLKDPSFSQEIENSTYFARNSFFFRDVLLPAKVLALLDLSYSHDII